MGKKNQNEDMDSLVNRPIEDIIKELKIACNCNRYPMFVSVAMRNKKNDKTTYYNDCLLASLEEPNYITRINKLLLSLNGVDTDIPQHIKKCVSDLSSFVEQYKASKLKMSSGDPDFANETLQNEYLLAEGILNASVPSKLFINESGDSDIDDLDELDDF